MPDRSHRPNAKNLRPHPQDPRGDLFHQARRGAHAWHILRPKDADVNSHNFEDATWLKNRGWRCVSRTEA